MTGEEELDRRTFLAAGLGAGSWLLAGCAAASAPTPAPARARAGGRRPPYPIRRPEPRTLAEAIRGPVLTHGDRGFRAAAHIYNRRFDHVLPRAIGRPVDARDVRDAVRWAVARDVAIRARSGGHSYAGYSTLEHGVVLDLRRLRGVHVDRGSGIAEIGAGAQLIDVYAGLAARGVTLPGGSCPSVGIAGVTLGGGMGLAGRALGLTADHLVGAQIVTADGRLRDVDARHDAGLLWALRGGGGGNFGIVTRLRFRVRALPPAAAYFFVSWPWSSAGEAIAAWLAWAPHTDDRATSILHLTGGGGTTSVSVSGQYLGPEADLPRLLAPLAAVPGVRVSTGTQAYLPLQLRWAGCAGHGLRPCHTVGAAPGGTLARAAFRARSDYLRHPLPAAALAHLTASAEARAGRPGSGAILFDAYGGAINHVAPDATAFVHRDMLCAIQYLSYDDDARWLTATWRGMRAHVSGQAYQNYIDADLRGWPRAYYAGNLARLRHVRRRVDPDRFFRFPQAID